MDKKVGIILVNYQDYAARFLIPCRDSLRAQTYPADLWSVYIIDNASTADSLSYLKNNFPEAKIIARPDGNYTAANNLGFKTAQREACDYLVTVNMDTEMAPAWLEELVLALENNPSAGLAQSKILLYPRTEAERQAPKINSLGNLIHFLGFGFTDGYGEDDREISGYPEIKGYASGCSFIISREVLAKIGGYNEEYYMYHDDLELSLKARLAGYQIILAPRSIIYHKYEFTRSTKMIYYMERNRYMTLISFYPTYLLFLIALPGFIMDIGLFFFSLINGWFREEMKIYAYFSHLKNYRQLDQERQRIKALSIIPFKDMARNFSGRIAFQEINNPILKYLVNPALDIYWRLVKKII